MAEFSIFDGHNDTLLRFYQNDDVNFSDFFTEMKDGHIDLPRARQGGFAGGFFAVYVPNPNRRIAPDSMPDMTKPYVPEALELRYSQGIALRSMADLFRLEAESAGQIKVVRTADELQGCIDKDIFAAIMHFEGAEAIDEDLDALEVFYRAGMRSLGIVWSRPTIFASGVPFAFPSSPDIGPGLTDAGKRAGQTLQRIGHHDRPVAFERARILGRSGIKRCAAGRYTFQCACAVPGIAQSDRQATGCDQGVGRHGRSQFCHRLLAGGRRTGS